MKPEEKDDRMQYWVAVLGATYIAIVVVGTVVMYMGSQVAGEMMRARYELSFSGTSPVSLFTVS